MTSVNINDGCNFGCSYCYSQLHNEDIHVMSEETAHNVINFCLNNNIRNVTIPEKEPTLDYNRLNFILKEFNKAGIKVSGITSNLYNLRLSTIELLKEYMTHVLVSYDGLWQDKQRLLLGGGKTNDIVLRNIYALKGANVNFGIACTITKENCDSIYDNYEFLKGITSSIAFNFDVTSDHRITEEELCLVEEQFKKISSKDLKIFPLHKIASRIKSGVRYTNFMCGAGRGEYTIDWDGTLYPCYHAIAWRNMDINIGNIREGVVEENRKMFTHTDTATPEVCSKCNSAICGICYTSSYDVTGKMNMPIEMNCKIFRTLTNVVKEAM